MFCQFVPARTYRVSHASGMSLQCAPSVHQQNLPMWFAVRDVARPQCVTQRPVRGDPNSDYLIISYKSNATKETKTAQIQLPHSFPNANIAGTKDVVWLQATSDLHSILQDFTDADTVTIEFVSANPTDHQRGFKFTSTPDGNPIVIPTSTLSNPVLTLQIDGRSGPGSGTDWQWLVVKSNNGVYETFQKFFDVFPSIRVDDFNKYTVTDMEIL